jgi:hypothetical protein
MSKLSKLTWLKRTNGHEFTGAEFRVLVAIFNRTGQEGRRAHPGVEALMEETGYGSTSVSAALASLKRRGWIHETYKGNGLSSHASVFDLVPDAPNPGYVCPPERAGSCIACRNTTTPPVVLDPPNSAAPPVVLERNTTGPAANNTAPAVPIPPVHRLPSDPVSDPKGSDPSGDGGSRPSDPASKVRYSPNHGEPFVSAKGRYDQESAFDADAWLLEAAEPTAADREGECTDSMDPTDPFSAAFVPPHQREKTSTP